jgi:hypothetical protein
MNLKIKYNVRVRAGIHLAQGKAHWWTLVNTAMNLLGSQKVEDTFRV